MRWKWVRQKGEYANGYNMVLAEKWVVGTVVWSSVAQDDPLTWQAGCRLPGIKNDLGRFEESSDAKRKVEQGVTHWFRKALFLGHNTPEIERYTPPKASETPKSEKPKAGKTGKRIKRRGNAPASVKSK